MGGDCSKTKPTGEVDPPISKVNFDLKYAIGRGGFGKVWRVESKKDKEHFAMKEMAKARIIHKKSI
jgi:protein kinase A